MLDIVQLSCQHDLSPFELVVITFLVELICEIDYKIEVDPVFVDGVPDIECCFKTLFLPFIQDRLSYMQRLRLNCCYQLFQDYV